MNTITIYLTGDCNLRCNHCSVGLDQYNLRPTLSTEDIITILSKAKVHGVKFVTFLGGEPTYSDHDLPKIFEYAELIGMKLSINTNLIKFDKIETLVKYKSLSSIVVSVDGATKKTHNSMRGRGSFESTYKNLKKIIEIRNKNRPDLIIDMTFTMTDLNKSDSISIFKLAEEININHLSIGLVQLIGRAKQFNDKIEGNNNEYIQSLAKGLLYYLLIKPKFTLSVPLPPAVGNYMQCKYGIPQHIFINPELCGGTGVYTYVDLRGNLLPCPGMSYEEGRDNSMDVNFKDLDILNRSISEIENTNIFKIFETQRIEKSKNKIFKPCDICKYIDSCSPCTSSIYKDDYANEISLCQNVKNLCDQSGENYNIFNDNSLDGFLGNI